MFSEVTVVKNKFSDLSNSKLLFVFCYVWRIQKIFGTFQSFCLEQLFSEKMNLYHENLESLFWLFHWTGSILLMKRKATQKSLPRLL